MPRARSDTVMDDHGDACRPPFNPDLLTAAETFTLSCASRGEWAVFEEARRGRIRGEFIRHLLLGLNAGASSLPIAAAATPVEGWVLRSTGLRIRNADVDGSIDLSDHGGSAAGLPALALENCLISGTIAIRHTAIARLGLRGSRFGLLDAQAANINGPLDLIGVSPFETAGDERVCWIDAAGSRIRGSVDCSSARLWAPVARPTDALPAGSSRYALRLTNAVVDGDINLTDCRVRGGVSLGAAEIKGDVRCWGTKLAAGEGPAFDAQSTTFNGLLSLSRRALVLGQVWMLNARIRGALEIDGARLALTRRDGEAGSEHAIVADNIQVGQSLTIENAAVRGGVALNGGTVGGDLFILGVSTRPATGSTLPSNLTAVGMTLGGSLSIDRNTVIDGRVDFSLLVVRGKVVLAWFAVHRWRPAPAGSEADDQPDMSELALVLEGARVSGGVDIGRINADSCEIRGEVSLKGAQIGGDLRVQNTRIRSRFRREYNTAMTMTGLRIGGSVMLGRALRTDGLVDLVRSRIGGSLALEKCRISNGGHDGLRLTSAEVAGDVVLRDSRIEGNSMLNRMSVKGGLRWDFIEIFSAAAEGERCVSLDLSGSTIANVLTARKLNPQRRYGLRINLSGLSVKSIEDFDIVEGWGDGSAINFDGFVYERLESFPVSRDRSQLASPIEVLLRVALRSLLAFVRSAAIRLITALRRAGWIASASARLDRRTRPWRGAATRVPGATFVGGAIQALFASATRRMVLAARNDYHPHAIVPPRLAWLERQQRFLAGPASENGFYPQPYKQLARVLRLQGHEEAARAITIAERRAAPHPTIGANIVRNLFDVGFSFGLSPWRATMSMILIWLLGWSMVSAAASRHLLARSAAVLPVSAPEQPCGAAMMPSLYALDLMIPVIHLQQEDGCGLSAAPRRGSHVWRWLFALFSILGKVTVSLAVLTYTGVLKRQE